MKRLSQETYGRWEVCEAASFPTLKNISRHVLNSGGRLGEAMILLSMIVGVIFIGKIRGIKMI